MARGEVIRGPRSGEVSRLGLTSAGFIAEILVLAPEPVQPRHYRFRTPRRRRAAGAAFLPDAVCYLVFGQFPARQPRRNRFAEDRRRGDGLKQNPESLAARRPHKSRSSFRQSDAPIPAFNELQPLCRGRVVGALPGIEIEKLRDFRRVGRFVRIKLNGGNDRPQRVGLRKHLRRRRDRARLPVKLVKRAMTTLMPKFPARPEPESPGHAGLEVVAEFCLSRAGCLDEVLQARE